MSLSRKAIRHFVALVLEDATAAGSNVRRGRPDRTWQGEGSALFVYSRNAVVRVFNQAPRVYEHELEVSVEGHVPENETGNTADDLADDLAQQVLDTLLPNMGLDPCPLPIDSGKSGLVREETDQSDELERFVGAFRLTFLFVYRTEVDELPHARAHALKVFGVDWDLAPPDGVIDAEDDIRTLNP